MLSVLGIIFTIIIVGYLIYRIGEFIMGSGILIILAFLGVCALIGFLVLIF